ncbi:hypothetical protein [Ammoniphilus sp. YIM 78166]|uniref:hypothetical protein n=1 Tax=Ammoniphilus sp. YIM 78166 TaxID=1644106 RepID=UPI00106FFE0B|nr:hypothetical protein [Ammoniphilus sp. YIM 78166]
MRKSMVYWIGTLTALSVLTSACQSQPTPAVQLQEKIVQEEAKVLSKGEETRLLVLDKLQPGMTEEEIRGLFGGDFALVENAMAGNETWRYDIGRSSGYQFDDQGIDRVDLEGIKIRSVEAQLFIDWTDQGVVETAALYLYNEQEKGTFYEYHIDVNGAEEVLRSFE